MKKTIVLCLATTMLFSSCATIFGGKVTDCQKTKPQGGARQVRAAALILDIVLFWPGAIIDFADNSIYKPCAKK